MEEADLQTAEMKKSCYEFNRDIVQGSVNLVSYLVMFKIG